MPSEPRPKNWRRRPDEDGEGGETWEAAYAESDQSRIAAEEHAEQLQRDLSAAEERIRELRAELEGQRRVNKVQSNERFMVGAVYGGR